MTVRDLFEELGFDKSYSRWDAERDDDFTVSDDDFDPEPDPLDDWDESLDADEPEFV